MLPPPTIKRSTSSFIHSRKRPFLSTMSPRSIMLDDYDEFTISDGALNLCDHMAAEEKLIPNTTEDYDKLSSISNLRKTKLKQRCGTSYGSSHTARTLKLSVETGRQFQSKDVCESAQPLNLPTPPHTARLSLLRTPPRNKQSTRHTKSSHTQSAWHSSRRAPESSITKLFDQLIHNAERGYPVSV